MATLHYADCVPWAFATSPSHQRHLGRTALPKGCSDQAAANVWIISWSGARDICAGSCEHMLAITTISERTGHWTKMRPPFDLLSGSEPPRHTRSSVDFITITPEFWL